MVQTDSGALIIPTMRYRDARAAVDWLCDAFGFAPHLVVDGEDGDVVHAELTYRNGMIMLGAARDDAFGRLSRLPGQAGGVTQSPYIVVADPDAHYAQAKAAGAEIVTDIKNEDYGGRGYSCRDPEGHLWNFGSYDPWTVE